MLNFGLRGYPGSLFYLLYAGSGIYPQRSLWRRCRRLLFDSPANGRENSTSGTGRTGCGYQKMSVLPGHLATLAMNRYLRLTWWGMIVVVLVAALLAPWVVVPVLGPAYVRVVGPTQILLAGVAFIGVSQLLNVYLVNHLQRPGLASLLAWVGVALGLTLAILIIPRNGEKRTAWAVVSISIRQPSLCGPLPIRNWHQY